MATNTVKKIEQAIRTLSAREIAELYAWLEQHYPNPIDACIESDLASGRLDGAIQGALDDEKNGRVGPL